MIIECPKCKTQFEVSDDVLKSSDVKFQCAECSFLWTEHMNKNVKVEEKVQVSFEDEKLPSCLVEEKKEVINDKDKKSLKTYFKIDNLLVFVLVFVLCLVVFFVVQDISNMNVNDSGKSIFDVSSDDKERSEKLYIEIAKPLTLVKEGSNEYIMIRGFIYNPTDKLMKLPKLVIRLENVAGRVLQEQEREVEKTELAPLEKSDFMFKVFKFSDKVQRVKVEFVETDKI